jgi:hypothetical protein
VKSENEKTGLMVQFYSSSVQFSCSYFPVIRTGPLSSSPGHGRSHATRASGQGEHGCGAAAQPALEQLPKPTKPVIPKCIPPLLLKDFLAGGAGLGQKEGDNTSGNDDSAGRTGNDADDNDNDEQGD